ncbi:MAG: hypothetical protein IPF78_03880 [Flavobacteriales bacterium]|nr:hypothetical protein [Flavobacteriales bacterium]
MRRYLLLLLVAVPLLLFGQAGSTGGYGPLTAHLKAIGDADSDSASDSASALVKKELGAILNSDSGLTASFAGVPISHVSAPDGAFRLFTWNVRRGNGSFLYEGYLLVPGRKKHALYELRDMTDHITKASAVQLTPENWYGALYYAVIPVKRGGKTYYTLLGWKGFSPVETLKGDRGAEPRRLHAEVRCALVPSRPTAASAGGLRLHRPGQHAAEVDARAQGHRGGPPLAHPPGVRRTTGLHGPGPQLRQLYVGQGPLAAGPGCRPAPDRQKQAVQCSAQGRTIAADLEAEPVQNRQIFYFDRLFRPER